jgi:hypothetical protein
VYDPAETLDWIAQVAGKSWATDRIIADLVCALGDMLDLQANMCSMGESRTVNVKKAVKARTVRRACFMTIQLPRAEQVHSEQEAYPLTPHPHPLPMRETGGPTQKNR